MQDQPLVSGVHGCTDQAEQARVAARHRALRASQIGIDGFAGDVLEHQVGSALFGGAGIEQPRHVRMIE